MFLGLAALAVYLLSERNSQTFSLHVVEDTLVIHKGKFLPKGSKPWNPENQAYAPVALEGFWPAQVETVQYKNILELDKALFDILETLARPRILSEEATRQERGLYYLNRAERLKGISDEQQALLKTLRAEAAFFLARTRLAQAKLFLQETVEQFRLATQIPNKNTPLAGHALLALEPALKLLHLAIEQALLGTGELPPAEEAPQGEGPPPSE